MNVLRQFFCQERSLPARLSLALVLMASLFCATLACPVAVPAKMQAGGLCATMNCERGCCAEMSCCRVIEQGKAPLSAALGAKQQTDVQLAPPEPRLCAQVLVFEVREHAFVFGRDGGKGHAVSPFLTSCIRLI